MGSFTQKKEELQQSSSKPRWKRLLTCQSPLYDLSTQKVYYTNQLFVGRVEEDGSLTKFNPEGVLYEPTTFIVDPQHGEQDRIVHIKFLRKQGDGFKCSLMNKPEV